MLLSVTLIKFNLLDFFQLPLEWAGGVKRASLEGREKEFAEEKFPLEIVQTSVHCTGRHQKERSASHPEERDGGLLNIYAISFAIFSIQPLFLPSIAGETSIFGLPDLAFAFKIKFFVFVSLSRPPVDQLGGQRKDENPEKCIFHKN